jgi:HYR domain
MHRRSLGRATALATAGLLAFSGLAFADSVLTDGDAVTVGTQGNVHIGTVAPGATVVVPVSFALRCGNGTHVDPGQTVTLSSAGWSAAPGGTIVSVTSGTVGPVPAGWPADGQLCPDTALPLVTTGTPSIITLTAPMAVNVGYTYTVGFLRAYAPAGTNDAAAVGLTPSMVIRLDVATNTPPVLTGPSDQTVEGNAVGGWTAAYPGVTATDAQDDPDPTPTCLPTAGTVLPLGPTLVNCSVQDAGGLVDTHSWTVTVVDTTDPSIAAHADVAATTTDPAGTAVTFTAPTATDVVDASPTVGCLPASGSLFPVGNTTVTCTATDDSGNTTTSAFTVAVELEVVEPDPTASAAWREPVGMASGGTFATNPGRTLPIKVDLSVDGVARTTGVAGLGIATCAGVAVATMPLAYHGGRWNAALDTSRLTGPCYLVSATIDGLSAGWFRLELAAATAKAKPKAAPVVAPAKAVKQQLKAVKIQHKVVRQQVRQAIKVLKAAHRAARHDAKHRH